MTALMSWLFLFSVELCTPSRVDAFSVLSPPHPRWSSALRLSAPPAADATSATAVDPQREAVKLFGRLAEKFIMLDASAGQCCYSGCKDCEYRLPGGGYRMADQSSARPKWIPAYSLREANGRRHETKWSAALFGADERARGIGLAEFVERIQSVEYAPPLGGPSVSASDAGIDDTRAAEALFVALAGSAEAVLSKEAFSSRLRDLAGGEEGLTWAAFQSALGL